VMPVLLTEWVDSGEGTITSSQNFDLGKFPYNILFSDIVFKHVQWMAKRSVIFVPRLATL